MVKRKKEETRERNARERSDMHVIGLARRGRRGLLNTPVDAGIDVCLRAMFMREAAYSNAILLQ